MSTAAREKLRAYKAEHGLSLRDLGELLGVSGANVESLLRTRQMPRVMLALRIERVCAIPAADWGVETPSRDERERSERVESARTRLHGHHGERRTP